MRATIEGTQVGPFESVEATRIKRFAMSHIEIESSRVTLFKVLTTGQIASGSSHSFVPVSYKMLCRLHRTNCFRHVTTSCKLKTLLNGTISDERKHNILAFAHATMDLTQHQTIIFAEQKVVRAAAVNEFIIIRPQ
ncbi:jg1610 [Pararge aegeria aegeria]|uniref:Jg1610 protein n=1 Tax=Pararge aegeria aegeria TaxID=348720 RepID=A0A8S4RCJ9_9NEOP|nr:jg1610 [Pararge aegeria aegeria]